MRLARYFRANNARRHALIEKDLLSPEETAELKQLQEWCARWVNEHHPWNAEYLNSLERRAGLRKAEHDHEQDMVP